MPRALITGAGIRIGRAVAVALARAGYDVILHANRNVDALQDVATEVRALGRGTELVAADLSRDDGIASLVRAVNGPLEVLVNNAGLFEKLPFETITRAQYRTMLAVNLDAPFFLTQALLPSLRAAQGALVVNLTDIAGERPIKGYAHYSVSKAGLIMLTRALAVELAPDVRVNGVSPGTVAFPEDFTDEQKASIRKRIPMGVEGSVDDIARTVVFLAKDAPYITGQVIAVDGGRSAVL